MQFLDPQKLPTAPFCNPYRPFHRKWLRPLKGRLALLDEQAEAPVINHPEVAILGVNAIRKRPVVKGDQIAVADMMFLSLSVDHRVVDGADAARFMNRMVFFLSEPTRLVFA
ncbi:MAG: hypothetical protein EBZ49_13155 [Proteobacteria bacterium]|nr:hypothetical protein [Pseudomonadota bacterium]